MPRAAQFFLPVLLAFSVFVTGGVAHSAPVQVDASASAAQPGAAARMELGGSREARTVDLLVDMQPRTAGFEFTRKRPQDDRAAAGGGSPGRAEDRGSAAGGREPVITPSPAAAAQQTGLFGAGAVPPTANAAKPAGGSQEAGAQSGGGGAGSGGHRPASHASTEAADAGDGPGYRILPVFRHIVNFVRDNREWVIGGAASMLAAIWIASLAAARSRR